MDVWQRFTVGLADVKDVLDLPALNAGAGALVVLVVFVLVSTPVHDRCDHADAAFAFADLPAEALPGSISGDVGGRWQLRADQQAVAPQLWPIASDA